MSSGAVVCKMRTFSNSGPHQPCVRLGDPLPADAMSRIERTLQVRHFKWDTQVGDQRVLSPQPLLISETEWNWICTQAEQAAQEISHIEQEVAGNKDLQTRIGLPHAFRNLLASQASCDLRVLRFDFHPTEAGWIVSEVNSDVPGGFTEASHLPRLYEAHQAGLVRPTSPLHAWGKMMESELGKAHVALLYAPGYLEDQQVALALSRELNDRELVPCLLQSPESLLWTDGHAHLRSNARIRFAAVVRFYQAEWLSQLPRRAGWESLFRPNNSTTVVNPALSVISESKRLPLIFPFLTSTSAVCRALFASCLDPRDLSLGMQEKWVLKAAYANTGDHVYLGSEIHSSVWKKLLRVAQKHPEQWVVQERFETISLSSSLGSVKPCVGVFVIGGRAAGAYVRLSHTQITDAYALEAPLFIIPNGGF